MNRASWKHLVFLLGVVSLAGLIAAMTLSQAQEQGSLVEPVKIKEQVHVAAAATRTCQEMEAADVALSRQGRQPTSRVLKPFLTRMGEPAYRALKEQLEAAPIGAKTSVDTVGLAATVSPPAVQVNFEGVNMTEAGSFLPPDTHGAASTNRVVEGTNLHVDVYRKAAPFTRLSSVTLGSFFNYGFPNDMTDPRVLFDPVWKRFIVVAINIPEADPRTLIFIAVSKTSNPTGAWWIYTMQMDDGSTIWDYPMVGMDQDSIIITGNIFPMPTGGMLSTDLIAIAKSRLYNGAAFSVPRFTGLNSSAQPPVVLPPADPALVNNKTYIVSADADVDNSKIFVYTLLNSASPASQSISTNSITVPAFDFPPNAAQPGTAITLDTLDARFVNNSTQLVDPTTQTDRIFQVHTIRDGSFATPRFYHLDVTNLTVVQTGTFAASGTSYDFNASIAANKVKDIFVTWSSTDPNGGKNAQIRVSGKLAGETTIPAGAVMMQSNTFQPFAAPLNRWGDYSAVALDPSLASGKRAWVANQYIRNDGTWGTRLGRIGFN